MNAHQQMVKEFMLKAGQECPSFPTFPDEITTILREDLIQEELDELHNSDELHEVADAIGDLLYVVYGTAIAYGIDIEPIFAEIHRSNMSKFIDGYRRADGKWVKGPSYSPANLEPIIEAQQNP